MPNRTPSCSVLVLLIATAVAPVHAANPPKASLEWDLRLRHEAVDDAGFARRADATTARLRAGLRLAPAPGWSMLLEGEGVEESIIFVLPKALRDEAEQA